MASDFEQRLYRLEADVQAIRQQLASITAAIANLAQQQYAQPGPSGQGGSGGGPVYFDCTLSAALAHGTSITGQTIYKNVGGTRTALSGTFTVWNMGPNAADDIASGATVIVLQNNDPNNTFTASGVYC